MKFSSITLLYVTQLSSACWWEAGGWCRVRWGTEDRWDFFSFHQTSLYSRHFDSGFWWCGLPGAPVTFPTVVLSPIYIPAASLFPIAEIRNAPLAHRYLFQILKKTLRKNSPNFPSYLSQLLFFPWILENPSLWYIQKSLHLTSFFHIFLFSSVFTKVKVLENS